MRKSITLLCLVTTALAVPAFGCSGDQKVDAAQVLPRPRPEPPPPPQPQPQPRPGPTDTGDPAPKPPPSN